MSFAIPVDIEEQRIPLEARRHFPKYLLRFLWLARKQVPITPGSGTKTPARMHSRRRVPWKWRNTEFKGCGVA